MLTVHESSIPVIIKRLTALSGVLAKGEAHAKAKGVDEANYLTMRLVPDMLPLSAQVRIACDVPRRGMVRLSGGEPAPMEDKEGTFADLQARIADTIAVLEGITPESLEGAEERQVTLPTPRGEVLEFTGRYFLFGFVLANLHFHCTMAYALLRGAGVELGKADYMGAPA
ncbi:DUF1993 family protein [Novosphingobium sp. TH158]|uniref:DUF1993 domain-containing protein n=1 Tax=Novosphingobium sp. TH158 TaxID=2067455 RepID=UPI000C79C6B7|nr:DUF1993 domain-containing protein [Novosphingobium sp. TH158]PLK26921.1 DUF1993 domain-containing protein [Novosphingobium sp. TH158]